MAEFFHELLPEARISWRACKAAFMGEYREDNAVNAQMEWANIHMNPGENARSYYNRFVKMFRRAHSGKTLSLDSDEHMDKFLRGGTHGTQG